MVFDIVVGSVLGASEYVAEAVQQHLIEQGHTAECHFQPTLELLSPNSIIFVVTSTHGAGDLPDNIEAFASDLSQQDLSNREYMVIGLGDSSYDTYCGGAVTMENILAQAGATQKKPSLHIDVLHHPIPEETALEWLQSQEL